MRHAFGYIFWGLIVLVFDFSLNGFDILPDGLGYLLVAYGASQLTDQSHKFSLASWSSVFLALGWLLGLMAFDNLGWLIYCLMALLHLAMYWSLLSGIIDVSISHDRIDLAERAYSRRFAYAVVTGLALLIPLVKNQAGVAGPLILVSVVVGIVVAVMIIHLVYRVSHELA